MAASLRELYPGNVVRSGECRLGAFLAWNRKDQEGFVASFTDDGISEFMTRFPRVWCMLLRGARGPECQERTSTAWQIFSLPTPEFWGRSAYPARSVPVISASLLRLALRFAPESYGLGSESESSAWVICSGSTITLVQTSSFSCPTATFPKGRRASASIRSSAT